jgi:hypothetical protein
MLPTAANPGNIVVPLSTILDQLQGKLSGPEIDALLLGIVSRRRERVGPGDLITAELMNQVLADLADLATRVARLEAGGGQAPRQGVLIVHPTASTVLRVGDPLVIHGQNLLPGSVVLIENTSVAGIDGSTDNTRLTIPRIPAVDVAGGLPEAGRQVRLTVSNAAGQAVGAFVLRPFELVRPIGSMIIAPFSGPEEGTVFLPGGSYPFVFRVTADTRPDETFQVVANVGRAGWTAVPSQGEIFIPAAVDAHTPTVRSINVEVRIPATASDGETGQLHVTLASRRDPSFVWRSTPDVPIAVRAQAGATRALNLALSDTTAGQAAIRRNPDHTMTPLIGPAGGAGGMGQITLTVTRVDGTALEAGSYTVDTAELSALRGDTTPPRWQARLAGTTGNTVTLGGALDSLNIELTAQAGAPNAVLLVELTRSGDTTVSGYGEFPVELRA